MESYDVYLKVGEDDFERYPLNGLEFILMVRENSESAYAYGKNGPIAGRIYGYDIDKVKALRPEIVQVLISEDDPMLESIRLIRASQSNPHYTGA